MANETTQTTTGKQIREQAIEYLVQGNPAFETEIRTTDIARGRNPSIFDQMVAFARTKVSPVYITEHMQDGEHSYRAWTQIPKDFEKKGNQGMVYFDRRPDWGFNEDVALAELITSMEPHKFFGERNWQYGTLMKGAFPDNWASLAELS